MTLILHGLRASIRPGAIQGGVIQEIVNANFREPATSMGDLRAQVAACTVGRMRLVEVCDRYGHEVLSECIDAGLAHSEELMRNAIREIPDGIYHSEDFVDGDVISDIPIRVALRMTISGSEAELDFTGTDPQTKDFLNVPIASTLAAAFSAMTMVAASGGRQIPANEGCHRPVRVIVPAGSFLNPRPPAAVRARMCGAYRTFDAVLLALQQALPSRTPALGYNVNTTVGFTKSDGEKFRIFIEDIGGGWGATPYSDGADMLDAPLSNCKITPVEMLEIDHPYLRMVRYEYLPDSGGDGEFRGGLGSLREYEVLETGVSFFAYADRHRVVPRGANGGGDGDPGAFVHVSDGHTLRLSSKTATAVNRGDRIQVLAGGGGGYGRPEHRTVDRIDNDRREAKTTTTPALSSHPRQEETRA